MESSLAILRISMLLGGTDGQDKACMFALVALGWSKHLLEEEKTILSSGTVACTRGKFALVALGWSKHLLEEEKTILSSGTDLVTAFWRAHASCGAVR
jgi:hypothetical protein